MKIEFKITDRFLKEVLEALPEASESFEVESFEYTKPLFKLVDRETGERYTLGMLKARKGFAVFAQQVMNGNLSGLSLGPGWMVDSSDWDAPCVDAYVQCCVLGDVIYG